MRDAFDPAAGFIPATGGPAFVVMGAPIVLVELGMVGITGSPGFLNKGG